MTHITLLQDFVARLDLQLPWLLPSLETAELLMPASGRLLICVPLLAWLALLRHRRAAANRRFARIVL